jgi:hypothetical protein
VILHTLEATAAYGDAGKRSLAMAIAMLEAATLPSTYAQEVRLLSLTHSI